MRKFIILLLVAVGSVILLSGCSSQNNTPQPEKKNVTLQQGGQLKYGSMNEPNTLNPLLSDHLATAEVGKLVFSGLVALNEKGEWQPDLAVDVPTTANNGLSPDGRTVTYRLRSGVTWHDGSPFTSEDVKFTWQFIMNRKANIISREGYDRITGIDTPDKNTVVIRFREYYAPYITLFTTILPKHILENAADPNKAPFNRAPIGTGPFRFKEWQVAEALVFEANVNYFRGRPRLDSFIYKIVPDQNMVLTQLKAGELDMASQIAFTNLEKARAINNVRTVITPTMVWEHLDFNLDNMLFQDVKVRRAIAAAIDTQAIITALHKGIAIPAYGDQSPLSWAYNQSGQIPTRDVNAARDLLVQAGWTAGPDGIMTKNNKKLAFTLTVPTGNKQRELTAQKIAEQLKEIGISVEVRPLEAQTFFGDILKNRRFETALYAWVAGVEPDNYNLWNSRKIPSGANGGDGQNYPGWRNPEIDKLTDLGLRTTDMTARKDIYVRIQDVIREDCPIVPLYFRGNIDAVKTSVANYQPNSAPAGGFWNVWQWAFSK